MKTKKRRTKRRFGYELFPHAEQDEVRPLAVEVPYLYARAMAWQVLETGFAKANRELVAQRYELMCLARQQALFADAVLQGMRGDEAWRWALKHLDDAGEWVWERAEHYGVNPSMIKPYPCGPEPGSHMCGAGQPSGWRISVDGKESECEQCTEEAE
jgi:hypothetical protein